MRPLPTDLAPPDALSLPPRGAGGLRVPLTCEALFFLLLIGSVAIAPEPPGLDAPPELAAWLAAHREVSSHSRICGRETTAGSLRLRPLRKEQ